MDTADWRVEILPSAEAELARLPDRVEDDAIKAIVELGEDPFPVGSKLLRGHAGVYAIRCYRDQYRIIYRVLEKHRRVLVLRVRPRMNAYDGL